ncbi:acyltransferase [Cognatiyoonia sp. IB215182]|uniref:acyltransferase family protein n=1 Tax=Cognatiyoonia sp. IB215182 TaxID=3097353 RepID=UPI002A182847|nr:acyltransferase [Cognatiyoonia sp. IB215182]MDX8352206.1 acyltransferase [Cognatiyoonia sp. IB215182]
MPNSAFSFYLDITRALAAFAVVLYHFSHPLFTGGRYQAFHDLGLGPDAVIAFFVMSGFLIAFRVDTKNKTIATFTLSRLTRLVSVLLPALILGFIIDRSGAQLFPESYESVSYDPTTLFQQLFRGLTFSTEWYWDPIRLGTNVPLWSLSYEVAYYAAFAIAVFLRGHLRIMLMLGLCLLVGPNIVLLFPCWYMGVWLYHQVAEESFERRPFYLMLIPVVGYVLAQLVQLPEALLFLTAHVLSIEVFAQLRFSANFVWQLTVAMLFTAHLLALYHWCRNLRIVEGPLVNVTKFLARASFPVYVLHFPVMYFTQASLEAHSQGLGRDLILLGMTLATCIVLAALIEWCIRWQGRVLRRITRRNEISV